MDETRRQPLGAIQVVMALRILMRHAGELILFFCWENSFFCVAGVEKKPKPRYQTPEPGTARHFNNRAGTNGER